MPLERVNVLITEIGGTIGDIEGLPFTSYAPICQRSRESKCSFHSYDAVTQPAGSLQPKTKPTQQSVAKLREIGIQPDILICRTEQPITEEIREKLFCSVPKEAVIGMDVSHSIL